MTTGTACPVTTNPTTFLAIEHVTPAGYNGTWPIVAPSGGGTCTVTLNNSPGPATVLGTTRAANAQCSFSGTVGTNQTTGCDGQGVVFESCGVFSGNYIEQPFHEAFAMFNSWNNAAGRQDNCSIVNNLIVNVTQGNGHKNPIEIQSPALGGSLQVWSVPVTFANNTAFTSQDACIAVAGSSLSGGTGAVAKNNICVSTGGGITGGSVYSSHDYNDYFNATGVTCPVSGEPNSICTNPVFVSTATPYNANNFKLNATSSPAHNTGLNLTSLGITQLATDYFGTTRGSLWDIGFFSFSGGTTPANTPTFSPVAGTYTGAQWLTISSTSVGAIICYATSGTPATNGSTGCTTGTLYSGPVLVPSTETVSAVAGGTGFTDSSVGSAAFTINSVISPSGLFASNGSVIISGQGQAK